MASSIYNICVGAYTALGAWFGRTVGAGAGSALPVIGTATGGYVGGIVGGGIGGAISEKICPKPPSEASSMIQQGGAGAVASRLLM